MRTLSDARQIVNPFAGRDVNWLLDFRAETRGDHPFLIWEPFEGARAVWTYRQFRDRVLRVEPLGQVPDSLGQVRRLPG